MYKSRFGAYTRTGRSITLGRSVGESWSKTSGQKPPAGVWIIVIIVWLLLLKKLSKTANQQ